MKNGKLLAAAILAVMGLGAFARTAESVKPSGHVRWCGFNLLGMFCQTKQAQGDARIAGYFPEDHFQWMREWGFNFARLPLDYRYFVEKGDWMKPVEAQLGKLDEAVRYGRCYGIHVQINFHRAPGYCCNAPQEAKSLFRDPEPLIAFTNLWSVLAKRYRGIPNRDLSFDLVNEPAPVAFYGATPSNYAIVAQGAIAALSPEGNGRVI
ncbi:MAG: cellulase family glycosylhydrolase, partial [bacterium]|nr:cellulase family glycosylhydrolase [Candidatus Colisoma equi]